VVEPPPEQRLFVGARVHLKRALELGFRGVLERLDISTDDLAVDDQVAFAVEHVGDHEDLVVLRVGKLEGQLCGLDVPSADDRVGALHQVRPALQGDAPAHGAHGVPVPRAHVGVDGEADGVEHVVLAQVEDPVGDVLADRVGAAPGSVVAAACAAAPSTPTPTTARGSKGLAHAQQPQAPTSERGRLARLGGALLGEHGVGVGHPPRAQLLAVGERLQLAAHVGKVAHVPARHLQERALQAAQVVAQVEVLALDALDVAQARVEAPPEPRLDVALARGLCDQVEVGRKGHARLELGAVLRLEVEVDRGQHAPGAVAVLDRGRAKVEEPPEPVALGAAVLEQGVAEGGVGLVVAALGLELGGGVGGAATSAVGALRDEVAVEGAAVAVGAAPAAAAPAAARVGDAAVGAAVVGAHRRHAAAAIAASTASAHRCCCCWWCWC
jgi:hypothetical protein